MSDEVMVPRAEMKFAIAQAIWEIDRNESTAARTLMVAAQNLLTAASTPAGGREDIECPACDGSGKIVEAATTTGANQHSACQHDCEDCDGSGRILPQTEKGS